MMIITRFDELQWVYVAQQCAYGVWAIPWSMCWLLYTVFRCVRVLSIMWVFVWVCQLPFQRCGWEGLHTRLNHSYSGTYPLPSCHGVITSWPTHMLSQGINVRMRAKELAVLLSSDDRIQQERDKASVCVCVCVRERERERGGGACVCSVLTCLCV